MSSGELQTSLPSALPPGSEVAPSLVSRIFACRGFVAAFILLALAAAGLNLTVHFMQLHFRKEAVPMAMEFEQAVKETMGEEGKRASQWVRLVRETELDPDTQHALGTDKFLFCTYVRTAAFDKTPDELLQEFKGLPAQAQRGHVQEMRSKHPEAVVGLGLTYYTGSADTVAHIPERCYLGEGYEEVENDGRSWRGLRTRASGGGEGEVEYRFITFRSEQTQALRHVAYVFQVNGRYTNSYLVARETLANLFERRAYYAKIELSSEAAEAATAERSIHEFIKVALPYVEDALPDWNRSR